ncbi:hypothetical protein CC78DRAFT_517667 [Lojkania enalia]|uniref:Rhodopsin domain-containing protein n=1 Tax=Lojkania enalia TaxID=147567 RepID=A0A9P4KA13_9PLEO|nr:hypothetical protein CC78DRAFT_517667 [Didymosphaeria enalia]
MLKRTPRDQQDAGPLIKRLTWTLAAISIIVVSLRLYVRARIVRRLRWDDWTMLISIILGIGNTATVQVAVDYGLGRHQDTLDDATVLKALKYDYLAQPTAIMAPAFGRVSLALLLLTFAGNIKARRWLLWGIIVLQLIINTLCFSLILGQCRPIQLLWDKSLEGSCWDLRAQEYYGYFQSSFNCTTDFILAICPAVVIWELQMALPEKLSLIALMGLGIFAMVASIIKTILLKAVGSSSDYTYTTSIIVIWYSLEQYLVIIGGSAATLKPLIRKLRKRFTTRDTGSRGINGSGSYGLKPLGSKRSRPFSSHGGHVILGDGSSQTEILERSELHDGNIWKTVNVKVERESSSR